MGINRAFLEKTGMSKSFSCLFGAGFYQCKAAKSRRRKEIFNIFLCDKIFAVHSKRLVIKQMHL